MPESDEERKRSEDQKAQVLQHQYNRYQETMTELQTQLSTFVSQIQEHQLVDKSLTAIPPQSRNNRKCFKMIGGVLVSKSVDDVIKLLNGEIKGLEAQQKKTEKVLLDTRKEMESWMKTNNVKIVRGAN